ncbi:MAG: carboxypeptidase-like regulatory domain-containing protein [Tenacibaculum sp.]|nr:carboxypeptidase-like regulatory domain-containing protein [Tenacibaculum sp.]
MKKIKSWLVVGLFMITATAFAQTKISGNVVDESNQPLPGATVLVQGTTNGSTTDWDGNFSLTTKKQQGTVKVSYVGFKTRVLKFNGRKNFGTIKLQPSAESLEEVVITGLIDIAKDRKTPIAVSTIKASEIQEKLGSQEFPEILNHTPSVYATKSGGGYGDARINIRGFAQENIAVLINGVPVNDMENSRVYWSNWAGLSDVTTAMQVQRGLGSSKLAISSVGGTINIVTKTTDKKQGGTVFGSYGNDNYHKFLATYSTGKNENGFAASVLLSRTAGDGYVDGTKFEGYNYFLGLGWQIDEDHDLQFMITGAPQVHNQRTGSFYNMATMADYLKYGKKYNYNHGYLNGKEFNWTRNFYHKPVTSLNWNWNINEKSSLSTSAYLSFGRGGGTGELGKLNGKYASHKSLRNPENGEVMWDEIVRQNSGKNRGLIRRASINSHNWVGLLSNFNTKLTEEFTFDFGIDMRSYTGMHYRRLDNLLGTTGYGVYKDKNNKGKVYTETYSSDLGGLWNVFKSIDDDEKIAYHNDGKVHWYGAFTQLEYSKDAVSAFVQAGVSSQGFKRIDYFNYLESDPKRETKWKNLLGGNVKGGINWNINENHNIFVNGGFYSKQPSFDAIFLNYKNDVNPNPRNEKVMAYEFGYGFKTEKIRLNANLYRTHWKDRFYSISYKDKKGNRGKADMQGVEQVHMGLELDGTYQVTPEVKLFGMMSVGNWEYAKEVTGKAYDRDQNYIGDVTLYLDGVKVGNSAQNTASLGAQVKLFENLKIDYSHRFISRLYARVNAEDFSRKGHKGSLKLPSFNTGNLGVSYKIPFKKYTQSLTFRLNVNNLFNTEYIAESATNYFPRENDKTYKGVSVNNKVFFGYGRTWNLSVRYKF